MCLLPACLPATALRAAWLPRPANPASLSAPTPPMSCAHTVHNATAVGVVGIEDLACAPASPPSVCCVLCCLLIACVRRRHNAEECCSKCRGCLAWAWSSDLSCILCARCPSLRVCPAVPAFVCALLPQPSCVPRCPSLRVCPLTCLCCAGTQTPTSASSSSLALRWVLVPQ
jgi:hypothetical protein